MPAVENCDLGWGLSSKTQIYWKTLVVSGHAYDQVHCFYFKTRDIPFFQNAAAFPPHRVASAGIYCGRLPSSGQLHLRCIFKRRSLRPAILPLRKSLELERCVSFWFYPLPREAKPAEEHVEVLRMEPSIRRLWVQLRFTVAI